MHPQYASRFIKEYLIDWSAENANQIPFEPEDVIDEPSETGQTELPDFMKSE